MSDSDRSSPAPASPADPGDAEAAAFCSVALPRPVFHTFAYRVPPDVGPVERGMRVRVQLRGRLETGMVHDVGGDAPPGGVRDLLEVLDSEPVLSPGLLGVCDWVSEYYGAPPGLVYRTALPPGMLGTRRADSPAGVQRKVIGLAGEPLTLLERDGVFGRARRQREAYETLEAIGGSAVVAHLERHYGYSRRVLAGLVERGLATVWQEAVRREPFGDEAMEEAPPITPTPAQQAALEGLYRLGAGREPGVALLQGVTGSGKTAVYIRLIRRFLADGRGAIVLVPEIALTPQTVRRFRAAFGDTVAVLHSGMSEGERFDAWSEVREGRRRVAIGARSAVFAPVRDPGIIILDEEHDGSYKQSDTPRYHARAVAAIRGRLEGALVLLGSATPSLETWANARAGRYACYELPERVTPHPLPAVRLIDLRETRARAREEGAAPSTIVTQELGEALGGCLRKGEQSILLLNRRGFSTFLQCPGCGRVWSCPSCNVTLTYHRVRTGMLCHHCGHEERVPDRCDACGDDDLAFSGVGTEQVEQRVSELLPEARILRMDVDTTGGKGAHDRLLETMRRREADILIGTQMIAKGLDFPGVTLVGVVNADVGLNLPDFRAGERAFQLLAQVAGRAGRGGEPGEVLIQTSRPHHPALRAALRHDYRSFAEAELVERESPGYPPHRRLANLLVSGASEERVAEAADRLAAEARRLVRVHMLRSTEVVGPAPCPIDRIRSRWRWHFLLKSAYAPELGSLVRHFARVHARPGSGMRLEIDRDPEALL